MAVDGRCADVQSGRQSLVHVYVLNKLVHQCQVWSGLVCWYDFALSCIGYEPRCERSDVLFGMHAG